MKTEIYFCDNRTIVVLINERATATIAVTAQTTQQDFLKRLEQAISDDIGAETIKIEPFVLECLYGDGVNLEVEGVDELGETLNPSVVLNLAVAY